MQITELMNWNGERTAEGAPTPFEVHVGGGVGEGKEQTNGFAKFMAQGN